MWKSECTNGKKNPDRCDISENLTPRFQIDLEPKVFFSLTFTPGPINQNHGQSTKTPQRNVRSLRKKGFVKPFQGKPMVNPTKKHPPTQTAPVPSSCAYASSPGSAVWKRRPMFQELYLAYVRLFRGYNSMWYIHVKFKNTLIPALLLEFSWQQCVGIFTSSLSTAQILWVIKGTLTHN